MKLAKLLPQQMYPLTIGCPLFKAVLQIRRGNWDNLGIIFHENIRCDPPLDPSHRDISNKGSQHMFLLRNNKNYL